MKDASNTMTLGKITWMTEKKINAKKQISSLLYQSILIVLSQVHRYHEV